MNNNKQTSIIITTLISIIAIATSIYLTSIHFNILYGDVAYKSSCAVSEKIDCDAVNASEQSEFFNYPIALWGLATYILLLVISLFQLIFRNKYSENQKEYILAISFFSVLYSIYLAYIAVFQIKALCIPCCILWACNLAIFIISLALVKESPIRASILSIKDIFKFYKNKAMISFILVFVISFGVSALSYNIVKNSTLKKSLKKFAAKYEKMPKRTIDLGNAPSKGNSDAKIIIVEFSEFQCPFCKKVSGLLKNVFEKYQSKILFVFKHYPLDKKCNTKLSGSVHPNSCDAAIAATCAKEQGKFWEYHDMLFANRENLFPQDLLEYAESLNLDTENFYNCVRDPKSWTKVIDDIKTAEKLGIDSVPRIYINGKEFKGAVPKEFIISAIKYELAKQ